MSSKPEEKKYVIAVDIGTTNIRCYIYDKAFSIKGSAFRRVDLLYPQPGHVEINPEVLWLQFIAIVKEAITDSKLPVDKMSSLGISTQRNTFVTWHRESGKLFHNFIVWSDIRADRYVQDWNNCITMKSMRSGARFLFTISRKKRFLAASVLKFCTTHVTMRLLWMIDHIEELKRCCNENLVMFGTIETWLLWKLTNHLHHATDFSCASTTGMYDPFVMDWGDFLLKVTGIPRSILPEIKDTSGYFGECSADIFGAPIPITCLVGDQQSAMFGECCFSPGDIKCTLGTGTFIDIHTGNTPHASIAGLYPVIGWKIGAELVFLAEGNARSTGTIVNWAKSISLLTDISQSSDIAQSVSDTDGVYFIPAFSGIQFKPSAHQAPINDNQACAGFFGLKPSTTKAHLVRAILESVAFRVKQLYEAILSEADYKLNYIRADGGQAKNDFILQLISNIIGMPLNRPKELDMTSVGAAFLAGLSIGMWQDKEELKQFRITDNVFQPMDTWDTYKPIFRDWEKALQRSLYWYKSV